MNKEIRKTDVIAFFDRLARTWDDEMIISDRKVERILDNAGVSRGMKVLDVACGTGVMIPYYLKREVSGIVAVDISPEMIRIAADKFPQDPVRFLCADVETCDLDRDFDAIVVYNAFPHFPDPDRLIRILSGLLKKGGTLTVAHGMSREAIDTHHSGHAEKVSHGLMEAGDLAEIFRRYLAVTCVISDSEMYQVTGEK